MKENVITTKTFQFAILIVNLYQRLTIEKKEFILSKQLLRSGTSIGANVEESEGGVSRKDFIAKLQTAYKEAKETRYWLKLLYATNYLEKSDYDSLLSGIEEILKIIVAILKSSKNEEH
jgi:four helix bundle protein